MHKVLEKIKEEFLAMLPPTIYFFVMLHIIAIIRVLMVRAGQFEPSSTVSIAIASLILGKAVLIADMLPWINRFPEKPLIYNVSWKTVTYTVVAGIIHYMEHLWDFAREAGGIVAGNQKLLQEIVWPHFWAIQLLLVILVFQYCTTHELTRAVGRDKLMRIFFGPMPRPAA
jgi:hypothetical protein